jgi:hypothetical protein
MGFISAGFNFRFTFLAGAFFAGFATTFLAGAFAGFLTGFWAGFFLVGIEASRFGRFPQFQQPDFTGARSIFYEVHDPLHGFEYELTLREPQYRTTLRYMPMKGTTYPSMKDETKYETTH